MKITTHHTTKKKHPYRQEQNVNLKSYISSLNIKIKIPKDLDMRPYEEQYTKIFETTLTNFYKINSDRSEASR